MPNTDSSKIPYSNSILFKTGFFDLPNEPSASSIPSSEIVALQGEKTPFSNDHATRSRSREAGNQLTKLQASISTLLRNLFRPAPGSTNPNVRHQLRSSFTGTPPLTLTTAALRLAQTPATLLSQLSPDNAGLPSGASVTRLPDGRLLVGGGEGSHASKLTLIGQADRFNQNSQQFEVSNVNLSVPRAWHSGTVLPDGKVLVVGGIGADGKLVSGMELFNPQTLRLEHLHADEPSPRAYHTATLLTNGRILIAGGQTVEGSLQAGSSYSQLYDPATKSVTTLQSELFGLRSKHASRLLADGTVLLWGGYDDAGHPLDYGELYDPSSGTFSPTSLNPASSFDSAALPYLAASAPEDGSTNVPREVSIALRFSKPMRMESVNA
ncbi:MAG: hypothetical protein L0312_26200, partial [Acidobacteria bacterium]|nr:hypothetical protein [Acidobacteriota bacterium]